MADRAMASPQVQGQGGRKIEASYDYPVVGAGSSGCVLAARLSEDPACRVLLIEAGGADISRLLYKARRSGQPISEPMPIGPIVQYRRPKPQVAPSTGPRYPAARSIQTFCGSSQNAKRGQFHWAAQRDLIWVVARMNMVAGQPDFGSGVERRETCRRLTKRTPAPPSSLLRNSTPAYSSEATNASHVEARPPASSSSASSRLMVAMPIFEWLAKSA